MSEPKQTLGSFVTVNAMTPSFPLVFLVLMLCICLSMFLFSGRRAPHSFQAAWLPICLHGCNRLINPAVFKSRLLIHLFGTKCSQPLSIEYNKVYLLMYLLELTFVSLYQRIIPCLPVCLPIFTTLILHSAQQFDFPLSSPPSPAVALVSPFIICSKAFCNKTVWSSKHYVNGLHFG